MNQQKLINDLNRVFNPNDKSVKELIALINSSKSKQVADLSYFMNNGLQWNEKAKPEDVERVLNDLAQLKENVLAHEQNGVDGLSAACAVIINNLPCETNADVARLKQRINNVQLGLDSYDRLADKQSEIVDKTAEVVAKHIKPAPVNHHDEMDELTGTHFTHYHPQATKRALANVAYRNATSETPVNLIFKRMNQLSIDLDNVVDYAMKNNANPKSMPNALKDRMTQAQADSLSDGKWEQAVESAFDSEKGNLQRIFNTECKARQTQANIKAYQNMGYRNIKLITRHSSKVCRYCMGMEQKTVKITDVALGVNVPPFHPYCCCNVIPVIMN